jgi:hypothetical protein
MGSNWIFKFLKCNQQNACERAIEWDYFCETSTENPKETKKNSYYSCVKMVSHLSDDVFERGHGCCVNVPCRSEIFFQLIFRAFWRKAADFAEELALSQQIIKMSTLL